ncbi:hypothetical protein [Flavisolibacter ginsenosidimutans]|uniref:FkbM family methyltransferase n=1 Tax=Flavisolibacter ginsenosidimutans TaxID=661481 RepID=A0A5B8UIM0_9BACT|nr:hypothetical protein [Flavisolibacter ginsenosidimutans]QEC56504.1 hypothetical protein FSB75_11560 [Flavisolibacter ginsenosidimutans]
MPFFTKPFAKVYNTLYAFYHSRNDTDIQKLLTANLVLHNHARRTEEFIANIQAAEFRVFSQWGDDGIIQFLVNYLEIEHKNFIEFGIETYHEATTRFLLVQNNWSGFVMDSSKRNISQLKAQDIYWRHDVLALPAFVTKNNINQLIIDHGFENKVGLLHVDIDGNDYWIWKEISAIKPEIVIVEYNHRFGASMPYVMPYTDKPASGQERGASLLSLCDLAEEKGYCFIGCESHGVNAYFVRKDKIKDISPLTAEQGYVAAKAGNRFHHSNTKETSVYNTRTNKIEFIQLP